MKKGLIEQYIEVKNKIKELKKEEEQLSKQLLEEMYKNGIRGYKGYWGKIYLVVKEQFNFNEKILEEINIKKKEIEEIKHKAKDLGKCEIIKKYYIAYKNNKKQ